MDARTDLQFDDAHIVGSICIPMMHAGFGSKLAWLADREQEVVLIGRDDEDGRHAGQLAVAVGIRSLGGFLHGGMTSWRQEKREVQCTPREAVGQLYTRQQSDDRLQILDVREQEEWDAGHIPGSVSKPWHDICEMPAGLDAGRPIAVICASGQRAATAASLVKRFGGDEVIHVVDGGIPTGAARESHPTVLRARHRHGIGGAGCGMTRLGLSSISAHTSAATPAPCPQDRAWRGARRVSRVVKYIEQGAFPTFDRQASATCVWAIPPSAGQTVQMDGSAGVNCGDIWAPTRALRWEAVRAGPLRRRRAPIRGADSGGR